MIKIRHVIRGTMGFFFGIVITLILVIFASDIPIMVGSGIRDLIVWLQNDDEYLAICGVFGLFPVYRLLLWKFHFVPLLI